MVNGKAKGGAFERDTCRQLSRFIDPNSTETIFWRSSISGGRATQQAKKGIKNRTQMGDITCVHHSGRWLTENFYLECKFYKDLAVVGGLLFGRGILAKFWQDTCAAARRHERHPLLIARQNNLETLVVFNTDGLVTWRKTYSTPIVRLTSNTLGTERAYICLFTDVFTPKKVKRNVRAVR